MLEALGVHVHALSLSKSPSLAMLGPSGPSPHPGVLDSDATPQLQRSPPGGQQPGVTVNRLGNLSATFLLLKFVALPPELIK